MALPHQLRDKGFNHHGTSVGWGPALSLNADVRAYQCSLWLTFTMYLRASGPCVSPLCVQIIEVLDMREIDVLKKAPQVVGAAALRRALPRK